MAGMVLLDANVFNSWVGAPVSLLTVNMTTAAANRLAVLHVHLGGGSVSSITGGGLVWTRQNNTVAQRELWTAPVAAQQTNLTVTVNLSAAQSQIILTLDTYYVAGNGFIPTVGGTSAGAVGSSSTPGLAIVTANNGATIASYFQWTSSSFAPTVTAGAGYSLNGNHQWQTGTGNTSILATSDTANAGTSVTPRFDFGTDTASGNIINIEMEGPPPRRRTVAIL